jgi:hypothetical protein
LNSNRFQLFNGFIGQVATQNRIARKSLFIEKLQRWLIEHGDRLWRSMDGTRLAELLGIYYYVSAIKSPGACGPPGSKMGSGRVAGAAGGPPSSP